MTPETPTPTAAPPRSQDGPEIEWQLATEDLASVRRWLDAQTNVAGLNLHPLPALSLCDTYLDTADWKVLRAGFALRVRREGPRAEATLKSLHSERADRAERREITEMLPSGATRPEAAAGPVGTWLRAILGRASPRPLFTAQTHRERFAVSHGAPQRQIGEVALDETRLLDAEQRPLEQLQRVEIERVAGAPEALLPLVDALRSACRLEPARENKFAAGVRAAALTPPRL